MKNIKITETQLKMLLEHSQEQRNTVDTGQVLEMFDEPEMEPGHFDDSNELIRSCTERLASAVQMRDWYLVREVFMDLSHFNEENKSDKFSDGREDLVKNALNYPMNESDY